MAKYCGLIGYVMPIDNGDGIHTEEIFTKKARGDVLKISRRVQSADKVNDDITISNEISIIAEPFASTNYPRMKYAEYKGAKWKITNVEVKRPRLILTLGGLYNGS